MLHNMRAPQASPLSRRDLLKGSAAIGGALVIAAHVPLPVSYTHLTLPTILLV